jgi:hypothetical protein
MQNSRKLRLEDVEGSSLTIKLRDVVANFEMSWRGYSHPFSETRWRLQQADLIEEHANRQF